MSLVSASAARSLFKLGARAAGVTGAYVGATAAILLTVIGLRGVISSAELGGVLAYIFVASLSAGLEPATVKAAALGEGGADAAGLGVYLSVSALKAVAASPAIALVWRYSDPRLDLASLAWTPLIAAAGFCVTDLRVLLDLRRRHIVAVAIKQGSLAGGILLLGALVASGVSLFWAIGVSTLARVALIGAAPLLTPPGATEPAAWTRHAKRLLTDPRWLEIAAVSVIAAASGSADRVFGLRYLTPADYGGYYLTYELFSKFWLIPYVVGPILFARQVAGVDSGRFARGAWLVTGAAGGAFLLLVAGALALAPDLVKRVIGADYGLATLAFAAAIVIASFCQLKLAQVQAQGRSRRAMVSAGLTAAFSVGLFLAAASVWGGRGLLIAWVAKALFELATLTLGAPRGTGEAARAGR